MQIFAAGAVLEPHPIQLHVMRVSEHVPTCGHDAEVLKMQLAPAPQAQEGGGTACAMRMAHWQSISWAGVGNQIIIFLFFTKCRFSI